MTIDPHEETVDRDEVEEMTHVSRVSMHGPQTSAPKPTLRPMFVKEGIFPVVEGQMSDEKGLLSTEEGIMPLEEGVIPIMETLIPAKDVRDGILPVEGCLISAEDRTLHSTKSFKCKLCSFQTNFKGNMSRHVARVHTDKRFSCDICNKSFGYKYCLKEHVRSSHQGEPFLCEYCSKPFLSRSGLKDHRNLYHAPAPVSCQICDKRLLKKQLDQHMNSHLNLARHECATCKKHFVYKTSLNRHIKICSGDPGKYECIVCSKVFSCQTSLNDHTQAVHEKVDLPCPCGKTYNWRTALVRHQRKCEVYTTRFKN